MNYYKTLLINERGRDDERDNEKKKKSLTRRDNEMCEIIRMHALCIREGMRLYGCGIQIGKETETGAEKASKKKKNVLT